jgi:hypothetical protein
MSKIGQWAQAQHETTNDLQALMFEWTGRPLEDVSKRAMSALVWAARLYLRNDYCTMLFDDPEAPLLPDVKAEVMRRAQEAEQTNDHKELSR